MFEYCITSGAGTLLHYGIAPLDEMDEIFSKWCCSIGEPERRMWYEKASTDCQTGK